MKLSQLRSGKLWLSVLGTGLFLGLFFYRTDLDELFDALAEANYWWVAPAILLWFVSAWFRALRWHYLLRHLERLSTAALYPIVIIGYMANNLLPARTGELVRAYIMGERYRVSRMSTLGTIAVERLFDGIVLVAFLVGVGAFIGLENSLRILVVAMAAVFLVGLIAFLWAASASHRADRLIDLLLHLVPARFREAGRRWASSFVDGLTSLQDRGVIGAILLTTTVAWLLEGTMYYLVGLSFDLGEGFPTFLLVAGAANLAITVPSTSGGIGPFELATRETLASVGVASGAASAYAIALHGLLLLPVIVAGLGLLWVVNLSFARVVQQPEAQPSLPAAVEPVE